MTLSIERGRETTNKCGCCGKLSRSMRGFVSRDGGAYAVYLAGYTEKHDPVEGTVLVSIGDWSEGSQPSARRCVLMRVRKIQGRLQVMVGGPGDDPWGDTQVFGPILTREAALAAPDIQEFYHVVDHVLETDDRFTRYFGDLG